MSREDDRDYDRGNYDQEGNWDGIERRQVQYVYRNGNQGGVQDLSKTTLTIRDVILAAAAIGGVGFSIMGVWNNLNNEITTNKLNLTVLEKTMGKELDERKAYELKMEKEHDELKSRIESLETSVSQIYQKITSSNGRR